MQISMVVFDMAGTTVDERNVVYHTLHKAIEKFCPTISFEQVLLWGAGKEKLQAIRETLIGTNNVMSEENIQAIFQDFLQLLDLAYQNLMVIPTKNGSHIITTGFNPNLFTNKFPNVEIKKDSPTILYSI
jgi:phosphoglycolate phosphatase-like HAD superfamily hydrolase